MTSAERSSPVAEFTLFRDAFGHLRLQAADETAESASVVVPVRAFPIAAPDEGIALVGEDGQEKLWIDRLSALDPARRELIATALAEREFMPVIEKLLSVSTFATPSQWTVQTDRGETRFTLKGEEDIRRLGQQRLLIADHHGVHYLLPDLSKLDRHSRKLLDRFL